MDKGTAVEYLTKLGTESLESEMQAVREIGKTCVKIADFIEQQAEQIENMKCPTNCKHGGSGIHWCKINECVGCNLWELAGGSGE